MRHGDDHRGFLESHVAQDGPDDRFA